MGLPFAPDACRAIFNNRQSCVKIHISTYWLVHLAPERRHVYRRATYPNNQSPGCFEPRCPDLSGIYRGGATCTICLNQDAQDSKILRIEGGRTVTPILAKVPLTRTSPLIRGARGVRDLGGWLGKNRKRGGGEARRGGGSRVMMVGVAAPRSVRAAVGFRFGDLPAVFPAPSDPFPCRR